MDRAHFDDERLKRLRGYRNKPERDLSMHFLARQFKQQIERPHKQMQTIVALWRQLVPESLVAATRLESFQRGTLKIAVDTSAQLFELDRLLREGLQSELCAAHNGPAIRRIQLRVSDSGDKR